MSKRGRPTLYKDEMIKQGYAMGALGLTIEEIAKVWNVNVGTLYNWNKKHPEFMAAISRGKDEADLTVLKKLFEQCKDGNLQGIMFWLKNRIPQKWRGDHIAVTNTINVGSNGKLTDADRTREEALLGRLDKYFGTNGKK